MEATGNLLLEFVLVMFVALSVLFVFNWLRQPSVVAYIIAGMIAGPYGLHLISEPHMVETLGEFGVLMLLFFIGMEVSVTSLLKNWKVVIGGTLFQIAGSILVMALLGHFFDWETSRIVLLGFVTSLSSTAVVLSYLEANKKLDSEVGKDVIGVLLAQDILIAPMLIAISAFGGSFTLNTLVTQLVGAVVIAVGLYFLMRKKHKLPKFVRGGMTGNDYKLFVALIVCFGAALITSIFSLPLGLGAFIGGVVVSNIKTLAWVRHELGSFKTLFIALFFVSIGMLIDINFFFENALLVLAILLSVFTVNTFVNTGIFLGLGRTLKNSLYASTLLAPIGEFSFLLAAVGWQLGAIQFFTYQVVVLVIALSLIIGPFWHKLFNRYY